MSIKKNTIIILISFSMILIGISNISAEKTAINSISGKNLNTYNLLYSSNNININEPPDKPCNINPINNSINVSINVILTVCCYDPNGDPMDIYFYNADNDSLIGINEGVSQGFHGKTEWSNLDYNTTYNWYAIANDSEFENKSDIWHFTTLKNPIGNNPPNQPSDPSPAHNEIGLSINPVLSVIVSDPDGDSLNVSFFNASDDSLIGIDNDVVSGGVASVTWSDLDLNMTYSWYVIVNDSKDENLSDTWFFKTINIKLKIEISGGIGVNAFISNIGDDDAIDVEWNISINSFLGFIDESIDGNVAVIEEHDDIIAKKLLVFGFGFVDITVNADCDWATEVTETTNAILIGFFIILY